MTKKIDENSESETSASRLKLRYLKEQYDVQIISLKQTDNRMSNRHAILAAFLLVISASISELDFFFNQYTSVIVLALVSLTFLLMITFFSLTLYYLIKHLEVKVAVPAVVEEGFLNKEIPEDSVLNDFILNYLNAFKVNRSILSEMATTTNKVFKFNKFTYVFLLVYLFFLGVGRLFFST